MSPLTIRSVLDGWKTAEGEWDGRTLLRDDTYSDAIDLREAFQQIAQRRAVIRQKHIEVDVLADALDYARRIATRPNEHD
jgi:hypothetical protein